MATNRDLENWFSYHSPTLEQAGKYQAIRQAAKYFAAVIMDNTPDGSDQSSALYKLRECVMLANASIACYEPSKSDVAGPRRFDMEGNEQGYSAGAEVNRARR